MTMQRVYEWVYRHTAGRRAHAHRCRCCWKVIAEGEGVLCWAITHKKTWMVHTECADKRHSETYTWREVFNVWAGISDPKQVSVQH